MRSSPVFCLLVSSLFYLSACNKPQQSISGTDPSTTTAQIEQLIAQGKTSESGSIDSLSAIAKKLEQVNGATGNKTALVYGKMFSAHYLWMVSDHKGAMTIAIDCLGDAERWKVNRAIPQLYGMMANIYKENTDYKMAFAAADKGLSAAEANKDTAEVISLLGLRAMFTHSAWLNSHKTQNDNSLQYHLAALKMAEANPKYERMRIRFYDNIAQYYKDNKQFDEAIAYANKGIVLAYKYKQPRSLTYGYSWLGEAYYLKGDQAKGLAYIDSALKISTKIKEPYRQMEIYATLADYAILANNYKQAITYNRQSQQLRDSLQVQDNVKQISELQIRYETDKKDKEIALLDKEARARNHEIIYIVAGCLLFVVFCVLLLIQSRIIHKHNLVIRASNSQLNEALNNIAYIQSHELRKPVASILGLMNVIKGDDDHVDKDVLTKLEAAAKDLDAKIQAINQHTQV